MLYSGQNTFQSSSFVIYESLECCCAQTWEWSCNVWYPTGDHKEDSKIGLDAGDLRDYIFSIAIYRGL